ncbi:MAG: hypothetical protein ACK5KP_12030 [Paludibacteraceae bacterium]
MNKKKHIELQKLGKKRPFSLPETYFSDFESRMDEMIIEQGAKSPRFHFHPWMYGVVASLIGVVFLGQIYLTNAKNKQSTSDAYETYVLSQVNENTIVDYYLTSNADESSK